MEVKISIQKGTRLHAMSSSWTFHRSRFLSQILVRSGNLYRDETIGNSLKAIVHAQCEWADEAAEVINHIVHFMTMNAGTEND